MAGSEIFTGNMIIPGGQRWDEPIHNGPPKSACFVNPRAQSAAEQREQF
jgi:hypothetical protein